MQTSENAIKATFAAADSLDKLARFEPDVNDPILPLPSLGLDAPRPEEMATT